MEQYRKLSAEERCEMQSHGCTAENWDSIEICGNLSSATIYNCGFRGTVRIESPVVLRNVGTLANCEIHSGACIENTSVIETTECSSFGNGISSSVVNEGGGREVPLFTGLTSQLAYIIAMYRHRPETIERLQHMAEREYTLPSVSPICSIGYGARITACGIIRNVCIGHDAVIEGASFLNNGTVCSEKGQRTYIGPGVKMREFIVCGNSIIDNGTVAERCFFGNATHASALSAMDTLFFAGSHCENGEMCSVLAGPYTISHHKSTLLIAGMFSFFNAGSGTNQSNHLLKSGPVHQGIHLRGCKYGSDAYMMLPALDGPFTTVIGRHKSHPDTEYFPFSLVIEQDGHTWLMPASNLAASGQARDFTKWPKRDKRDTFSRDIINFEECNPYLAERIATAINISEELMAKDAGDVCTYRKLRIRTSMLRRGLRLYRLALSKYMGAMLACGAEPDMLGAGRWSDVGGMYIPVSVMDDILDGIDNGSIATINAVCDALSKAHAAYPRYAAGWAYARLKKELGHTPSDDDIAAAIAAGREAADKLATLAADDIRSEQDASMAVGYGIDAEDDVTRMADFKTVRHIQ